jgi:hypothetical protein
MPLEPTVYSPFAVRPLTSSKIPLAYPLLHAATDIALDRWRAYAASCTDPERVGDPPTSGIMCVEDAKGYIHGLFAYRVIPNLHCDFVLQCENVVAMHIVDERRIQEKLLEGMERLARRHDCRAIHVCFAEDRTLMIDTLPGRERHTRHQLQGADYVPGGLILCKTTSD